MQSDLIQNLIQNTKKPLPKPDDDTIKVIDVNLKPDQEHIKGELEVLDEEIDSDFEPE
jgi:hypothetical protein